MGFEGNSSLSSNIVMSVYHRLKEFKIKGEMGTDLYTEVNITILNFGYGRSPDISSNF